MIRIQLRLPRSGEFDISGQAIDSVTQEAGLPSVLGMLLTAADWLRVHMPTYDDAVAEPHGYAAVLEWPVPDAPEEFRVVSINDRVELRGLVEVGKVIVMGKMFQPNERRVLSPAEVKAIAQARRGH